MLTECPTISRKRPKIGVLVLALVSFFVPMASDGQTFEFGWVQPVQGSDADIVSDVATDSFGNVYVTGSFTGTASFGLNGSSPLTSNGDSDAFVASYDGDGNLRWARSVGDVGVDKGLAITVGTDGAVYAAGSFHGTVDFGLGGDQQLGTSVDASADLYVLKMSSAGMFDWVGIVSRLGDESPQDITVGKSKSVYMSGYFSQTSVRKHGDVPTVKGPANTDAFVLRLDSLGAFQWIHTITSATTDEDAPGIALDRNGNVHVIGSFGGTTNFDSGNTDTSVVALAESDVYMLKLDSDGVFQSVTSFEGTGTRHGFDIALDSKDNVIAAGTFSGTVDFAPDPRVVVPISSSGVSDLFIVKLDVAGVLQWAYTRGGTNVVEVRAVVTDSEDNVFAAGAFEGTVEFAKVIGEGRLQSVNGQDFFVVKLNSLSAFQFVDGTGGQADDGATSVAVDANGSVLTAGRFGSTDPLDFDTSAGDATLSGDGSEDGFLYKLEALRPTILGTTTDADGMPVGCVSILVEGVSSDFERGVFADADGAFVITGLPTDVDGLPSDDIRLTVSAPGYEPRGDPVVVALGDFDNETLLTEVDFVLDAVTPPPDTTVFGRVVDADDPNLALAGVRVQALLAGVPMNPVRVTYTCLNGRFEIRDLPATKVTSEITLEFTAPTYDEQILDAPDPGIALEVAMEKQTFFPNTLTGLITDGATNLPLEGAEVSVILQGGILGFTFTTGPDGFYLVVVPDDGNYTVTVSALGFTTSQAQGTVDGTTPITEVSVSLTVGGGDPDPGCGAQWRSDIDGNEGWADLILVIGCLIALLLSPSPCSRTRKALKRDTSAGTSA